MTPQTHTALSLAVDALAAQRLTRLMVEDVITEPLRDKWWSYFPAEERHGPGFVPTCPHCSGIYAAFAITATHAKPLRFLRPVVYALALASVPSLVADYARKPDGWG